MKLAKPLFCVLCDRHGIFPVRVINSWNSLPDNIVFVIRYGLQSVSKLHFCGHCSC